MIRSMHTLHMSFHSDLQYSNKHTNYAVQSEEVGIILQNDF